MTEHQVPTASAEDIAAFHVFADLLALSIEMTARFTGQTIDQVEADGTAYDFAERSLAIYRPDVLAGYRRVIATGDIPAQPDDQQ